MFIVFQRTKDKWKMIFQGYAMNPEVISCYAPVTVSSKDIAEWIDTSKHGDMLKFGRDFRVCNIDMTLAPDIGSIKGIYNQRVRPNPN